MTDPVVATMQTYDAIADSYAAHWAAQHPEAVAAYDRLRADLPAGALVADLGCGPGGHAQALQDRGFQARADSSITLAAWRRIAKPGAPLVLSTSVGDRDDWEPVRYETSRTRFYVHRTVQEVTDAVSRAGFGIVRTSQRRDRRDWLLVEAVAGA